MIWAIALFSFAVGVVCPFMVSISFVLYFSGAAAVIIAALVLLFGSSWSMVFLAWLSTIVAIQAGFAFSTLIQAVLAGDGGGRIFAALRRETARPAPADKSVVVRTKSKGQPHTDQHRAADG